MQAKTLTTLTIAVLLISAVSHQGKAGEDDTSLSPQPVEAEARIQFEQYGIDIPVPAGWEIVDCSKLKSIDDFTDPSRGYLDEYVRKNPGRTCCLQESAGTTPKPTVVLIPGDGFLKNSPEHSNMRAGSRTSASILVAQLAWLVIGRDAKVELQANVFSGAQVLGGKEEFIVQLKGDATCIGAVMPEKVDGLTVSLGIAASPEKLRAGLDAANALLKAIGESVQKRTSDKQ